MLTPAQELAEMLSLAATRHKSVLDKSGTPYFLHVMKVAILLNDPEDFQLMAIAVGHDLIEDTGTTYSELRKLGFSERVICGIRRLTKVSGETPEEYESRVMETVDSIRVKMADLTHNSDIRRIKEPGQKDFDRVVKYRTFFTKLKTKLKEISHEA